MLYKQTLFIFLFGFLFVPALTQAAVQPYYYLINYQKPAGVLVDVKINDAPVVKSLNGSFTAIALNTSNINPWLVAGTNTLSFTVKKAPNMRAPTSSTEIVISRIIAGEKANSGETLTYIVVPAKELKGTIKVTREFSVTTTPPSDFWIQAKPLELTAITKVLLTWKIYTTWQALHTKNVETIFNLLRYQFNELNRYNFEQVYTENEFKNDVLTPFTLAENVLQPLPSTPLHFEFLANKKIIKITDQTGHSPIKIGAGELEILAAPINGVWTLVR